MESQYLRARYYNVPNGNFLTEDSYLGDITDPLTLNRYNYVKSSPPNYADPSGHLVGVLITIGIITIAISGCGNKYERITTIEPSQGTQKETKKDTIIVIEQETSSPIKSETEKAEKLKAESSCAEEKEKEIKWIPDVFNINGTTDAEKYFAKFAANFTKSAWTQGIR